MKLTTQQRRIYEALIENDFFYSKAPSNEVEDAACRVAELFGEPYNKSAANAAQSAEKTSQHQQQNKPSQLTEKTSSGGEAESNKLSSAPYDDAELCNCPKCRKRRFKNI